MTVVFASSNFSMTVRRSAGHGIARRSRPIQFDITGLPRTSDRHERNRSWSDTPMCFGASAALTIKPLTITTSVILKGLIGTAVSDDRAERSLHLVLFL